MKRAILLQTCATKSKEDTLKMALSVAVAEANFMLSEVPKWKRFNDFHKFVYLVSKSKTSFNSQVICDIERQVWRSKGKRVSAMTIKFNVPRNCKVFEKSMPFIKVSVFSKNSISIPIIKNRNFQRYESLIKDGWICKTYGLTSNLQIVAYLSKEDIELPKRKNVLGIDINAKNIAVSIISDSGNVLYQTYFGKHIWVKRKNIMRRRSVMQSSNNIKALKRLRHKEEDFVETNIGQLVKEIMNLAIRFDADVAIEKLKRFKSKGKRFNKEVMRIPFYKIKQILISRCFDNGITLNIVDSWHTSKFCSKCGAVGKGHDSSNYALFRCKKCGVVVNSDRNASKNIAIKCLLERKDSTNHKIFQISNRRGLVNDLVRPDDVVSQIVSVRHDYQRDGMPRPLGRV